MFQRKPDLQSFLASTRPEPRDATILAPQLPPENTRMGLERRPSAPGDVIDATVISEETIISSDLTITGNVFSKGRVKLEGTIEGDMNCRSLVVGTTGSVTGSIIAEEVSVYGKVAGTVRGLRVNLFSSAHVEGDVFHQGIGIEMGTHYDGRLKWSDNPLEGSHPPEASPISGLGANGR
jgi:cytoskeletal protein CcmA (bactofilin family)